MKEKLLKIRKQLKKRKPAFTRQDINRYPRLEVKWRKPKGLHAKMRRKLKGYKRSPSKGWKSPALVRGLDADGLMPVNVKNIKSLLSLNPEEESAIISSAVGMRKRIEMLKEAIKLNIKILNVRDIQAYIKDYEDSLKKKKEEKLAVQKKKEEKKPEKKQDKKLTDKILSEEEKKEQEKKEKDKALIKKDAI